MTVLAAALGNRMTGMDRVLLFLFALIAVVAALSPPQAIDSVTFTAWNFLLLAPFIVLSVGLTAYATASGTDNLIVRAFTGRPATMIVAAALIGTLSPFCSCGVIPLIAALLVMGVPLSAVMAFWLASPLIDPSMYALTTGTLGIEFATAKLIVATVIGIGGGFAVLALQGAGFMANPLRPAIAEAKADGRDPENMPPVVWRFWHDAARRESFAKSASKNALFLGKWMALAFFLESLMIAYIPAGKVAVLVGTGGYGSIAIATLAGVPAYLNGYAALPLIGTLMEQGMAPGAAMAFLIGGGVTSVPAAMAVWALARTQIFAIYIALSLTGAFLSGLAFQAWATL